MRVVREISELRSALGASAASRAPVAFVPTMGNLHAGHLSLVRHARAALPGGAIAASIFVNRLQFAPSEDFDRYPRTFERDRAMLESEGVDVLFAPDESVLYPERQGFIVKPPPPADQLEGRFRPGFFDGVATVVLKLFNCVQPSVAVFGKKDYQQLQVIRAMVRQLDLPLRIVAGETVREPDGLAMSSRNAYLSAAERAEAPRLFRLLRAVASGTITIENSLQELERSGWKTDYIEVRKRSDLSPARAEDREKVVLAAARLGATRLIDNLEF